MGKTKKFIDKKKAATFQLFARDSTDPNYDDSAGSDRVFIRVDNSDYSVSSFMNDESHENISGSDQYHQDHDPNSIYADATDDEDEEDDDHAANRVGDHVNRVTGSQGGTRAVLPDSVRKEILELGFPDDGYNYLNHLRVIKNTGGGSAYYSNPKAQFELLPNDVKAYDASRVQISQEKSDYVENSMYSVASKTVTVRVQKAVDADVAALLDDSDLSRFGSDVEDIEEDFVVQANLPEEGDDLDIANKLTLDDKPDENTSLIGDPRGISKGVEKSLPLQGYLEKSVEDVAFNEAANYPMRSRDDGPGERQPRRRLLDDQFDMLEQQEYGSESDEEYYDDGYIGEEQESLAEKLGYTLIDRQKDDFELESEYATPAEILRKNDKPKSKEELDSAADLIRRCTEYGEKYENSNEVDEVVLVEESSDESEQWDCDTIVSTYSNLDNHPGKIDAPRKPRKTRMAGLVSDALNPNVPVISLRGKERLPVDFLPHRKAAVEKVKGAGGLKTQVLKRKQHGQESKEEKKERKAAVKEERRDARKVKKEMKELYRGEAQRAQRTAAISGPSSIHLM